MKAENILAVHQKEMLNVSTELCEIRKRETALLIRYDQLQIILTTVDQLTNDAAKDTDQPTDD